MPHRVLALGVILAGMLGLSGCGGSPGYSTATAVLSVGFPMEDPQVRTWVMTDGLIEYTEQRAGRTTTDSYPIVDAEALDDALHAALNAPQDDMCPDANMVSIQAQDPEGGEHSRDYLIQCGRNEQRVNDLVDALSRG